MRNFFSNLMSYVKYETNQSSQTAYKIYSYSYCRQVKEKMYKCDICGVISPTQELVVNHMNYKHKDFIEISPQWKFCAFCLTYNPTGHRGLHKCPSETGQCPLCTKKFNKRNKSWFAHMRTYHLEKVMVRIPSILHIYLLTYFILTLYFWILVF